MERMQSEWCLSKKSNPIFGTLSFFSKRSSALPRNYVLLSKQKLLNEPRYIIFFLALLFPQITQFVLNKQSIADIKCLNTHINCLRNLFNETDVFNTYEYVSKQNTCLHPFNEHVICHLTVFTYVCIAQYHVLFPLYMKSCCSCGLEKSLL